MPPTLKKEPNIDDMSDDEIEARRRRIKEETKFKANYDFIANVFSKGIDRYAATFKGTQIFDIYRDNF